MSKQIYLDNAATTQMSDAVKQAMEPYLQENYGKASTAYSLSLIHISEPTRLGMIS